MNANLAASYFDGETLRVHPVTVEAADRDQLHVFGEGIDLRVAAADLRISDRLGSIPFFVHLPDRGGIELPCNDTAVALLHALRPAGVLPALVHRLESHVAVAATAVIVLALAVAAALWQGLPWLAHRAAYAVPASIENDAGVAGYTYFAQAYPPTTLEYDQRNMAYRALDRLKKARKLHVEPRIYFFHLGLANAFALPGGIIVVGDELVELAHNEDELAGVLAHEIGHVEMRHGLQSVLRNSSALIVVSTVTGDLSTLSTFSGTLPFLLLEYGYNREFEREADAYAVSLLKDAHIDPFNFALILQRLESSRPTSGTDFSYLSTHPATEERVAFLRSFGSKLAAATAAGDAARADGESQARPEGAEAVAVGNSRFDVLPRAIFKPQPVYPADLRQAGIAGEVTVDFVVNTHGAVENARVIRSTQVGFNAPALEAIQHWKFQPGRKGGMAVNVHMQIPVGFTLRDANAVAAELAVISTTSTIPAEPDGGASSSAPDNMPYPLSRRPAIYPETMRAAGISGDVLVEFTVDARGDVMDARVVKSPHPDFDEPALAAVRRWKFQPAVKDSRAVNAQMRETLTFRLRDPESPR